MPKIFKKDTIKENYLDKQDKTLNLSRISPSIFLRPSKKFLEKLKFYKSKENQDVKGKGKQDKKLEKTNGQLYAQVSLSNIKKIININDNFPNLSSKKIQEV